eukprot:6160591-Pyramimonas_sp.AAC.1
MAELLEVGHDEVAELLVVLDDALGGPHVLAYAVALVAEAACPPLSAEDPRRHHLLALILGRGSASRRARTMCSH